MSAVVFHLGRGRSPQVTPIRKGGASKKRVTTGTASAEAILRRFTRTNAIHKGGDIATNRRDEQELSVLCLRVLQAALVYVHARDPIDVRGRLSPGQGAQPAGHADPEGGCQ